MVKVSVIIPIYNVEKYVGQCLESVINQTLREIEVICVDDGSTDLSGEIADCYGRRDDRVRVMHRENAGYGSAVNAGIGIATGEYIGIVESDDFIEPGMYERLHMVAKANDLDYVKADYYEYSDLGRKAYGKSSVCDYEVVYSESENMEKLFMIKSIWAGLYKRSFLADKGISFLETAGASYQDTSFWFKVCISAHRGMLIEDALVNYRIDNDSSSVKSSKKAFCICDEIEECRRYLDNMALMKDMFYPFFYRYMYICYCWNIGRIGEAHLKEFIVKTAGIMREAADSLASKNLATKAELEDMGFWAGAPELYYRTVLDSRIKQCNREAYAEMFRQYTAEENIYIYGAGKVGRRLEKIIHGMNPECRVRFLVSELAGSPEDTFQIDDARVNKEWKVVVAVAAPDTRLEMGRNAEKEGFRHIFLWDAVMEHACCGMGREGEGV